MNATLVEAAPWVYKRIRYDESQSLSGKRGKPAIDMKI